PVRGSAERGLRGGRGRLPREARAPLRGPVTKASRLRAERAEPGTAVGPGEAIRVQTVDYHTGGEPFRIVTGGVPAIPGATILDKRRHAQEHLDEIRRLLVFEPRGHADMYGCFVVEPEDDGADLGVLFFHNAGFSTACGHGTIALVTWALESGLLPATGEETGVVVDVPSGRLETVARVESGHVRSVRFRNVPSFIWGTNVLPGVDVAFGGAFYGSVEERVYADQLPRLIERGRELKADLEAAHDFVHPREP